MVSKSAVKDSRPVRARGAYRRSAGLPGVVLVLLPRAALAGIAASRGWAGPEEVSRPRRSSRKGCSCALGTRRRAPCLCSREGLSALAQSAEPPASSRALRLELGFFAEAELSLSEALATPNHPWIAKNRATLKRQLDAARANVGELSLTISPATAEVLLDKKSADKVVPERTIHLRKGRSSSRSARSVTSPVQTTITIVGGKREEPTFALVSDSPRRSCRWRNHPIGDAAGGCAPGRDRPSDPQASRCLGDREWGAARAGRGDHRSLQRRQQARRLQQTHQHGRWHGAPRHARRSASPHSASRSRTTTIGRSRFRSSASSRRGALAAASSVLFSSSPRPVMSATRSAGVAPSLACVRTSVFAGSAVACGFE